MNRTDREAVMSVNRHTIKRLGPLPWIGYAVVYIAVIAAMGLI